ncbi:hypothetical protein [Kribbella voronezhensis]|uniref:hypothetical protein n=1 Tax=Kribbella voronezhensis TaxID=2512212 RepID=UPI00192D2BCF|nr:hypothetical protein [Kribbella voronezhensis]
MKRQNTTQQKPRLFQLVRHTDVSGVRGTGTLAEGVEWSDGAVTLRWRGRWPATSVWDDGIEAVLAVHGRNGRTQIHWLATTHQLTQQQSTPRTAASHGSDSHRTAPPDSGSPRAARTAPPGSGSPRAARTAPPGSGSPRAARTAPPDSGSQQAARTAPPDSGSQQAARTAPPESGSQRAAPGSTGRLWLPAPGVDGLCARCGRGWPCLGCDP